MKKAADKKKAAKEPRVEKERAEPDRSRQTSWRDVMNKALEKKRPAEGWPDRKGKYEKPNQPKKR